MKAYKVTDHEYSEIVFHENASKAKYFAAINSEFFDEIEFIDLKVCRAHDFDHFAKKEPYILDFCENAGFFEKMNWECLGNEYCEEVCPLNGC